MEAGQILATVKQSNAELRLQQTRAALAKAQATLANAQEETARQQHLFMRNVASAAARNRATTAAERGSARMQQLIRSLDLVEASLADAILRAPFDGIINSVEVQSFGSVIAGQPIVTLYEDQGLQATILVSFDVASSFMLGQSVQVIPGYEDHTPLHATVSEIARRAPSVSSFPVVVALDAPHADLRSDMAVEVVVESALPEAFHGVSLPLGALGTHRPADLSTTGAHSAEIMVFAPAEDDRGHVHLRSVTLSAVVEDRLIVRDGPDRMSVS
ncbi:hypothetical protein A8B78_12095 [Jannaschia sp. EhC01]|nr:hypothetical protein A8B78_12095 [Jannaschia sp. EhC01]